MLGDYRLLHSLPRVLLCLSFVSFSVLLGFVSFLLLLYLQLLSHILIFDKTWYRLPSTPTKLLSAHDTNGVPGSGGGGGDGDDDGADDDDDDGDAADDNDGDADDDEHELLRCPQ